MNKMNLYILAISLVSLYSFSQQKDDTKKIVKANTEKPNLVFRDLIPDELTAVKIAEAVWLPIYGQKIYNQKPFKARLKDSGTWIVEGTLHKAKGGVAYIEIQKKDCKVLKVYHEK